MPRQLSVLLVGRKGQGKTRALRSILRQRSREAVLVDPSGELGGSGSLGPAGALEAAAAIQKAPKGSMVILDDADGFLRSSSRGVLQTTISYCRNLDVTVVLAVKTPTDVPAWLAANVDVVAHGQFRGRSHRAWAEELELSLDPVPEGHLLAERMDLPPLDAGGLEGELVESENFGPWLARKGLL